VVRNLVLLAAALVIVRGPAGAGEARGASQPVALGEADGGLP